MIAMTATPLFARMNRKEGRGSFPKRATSPFFFRASQRDSTQRERRELNLEVHPQML